MIDLRKAVLPDDVVVGGRRYGVKTDFHFWISFCEMQRESRDVVEYDFLYADMADVPDDRMAGFEELRRFAFPRNELPRPTGDDDGTVYYDLVKDGDLIYSAFLQQYGIDLVDASLHWHKFLALFHGLRETKLTDVMGYRGWKRPSGNMGEYDREMEKLKAAWELEYEMTDEETRKVKKFEDRLRG